MRNHFAQGAQATRVQRRGRWGTSTWFGEIASGSQADQAQAGSAEKGAVSPVAQGLGQRRYEAGVASAEGFTGSRIAQQGKKVLCFLIEA